jgi:DNA-binding SARP family transcriptional activator
VNLGKPLALLVYLVLSPNRSASRERLADLLWSDQERTVARNSLRRALSYLKSRIGPWVVDADESSCRASALVTADVIVFRELVAKADYEQALALYRGDFLADFASPGCREFESWAAVERAHLRSLAARAAEAWCRQALNGGQFGEARRAVSRMKEVDQNSELAWRLGIETLIATGDRVGAAAEGARFSAWWASEGREPDAASRELIQIAHRAPTSAAKQPASTQTLLVEFVGREKEFAAILDEWRRARAGAVRVVVITGAAGLGKSRLLDALADRIRSRRGRAVRVRAYPGERGIPLALAGAVAFEVSQLPGAAGVPSSVLGQLAALDLRLGEQFSVRATHEELSAPVASRAIAIRELIAAVADDGPLALLLDDLHWSDAASIQVLSGALSRLRDVPVLVVIATRAPTGTIDVEDRGLVLPLLPFTEANVDALISSLGTLPSNEDWPSFLVARTTAASRGIPLLVLSALEQLMSDGTLILRDGAWETGDRKQFRERIRNIDALATRLRTLSPESFRLLLSCSLAGMPLPTDIFQALEVVAGSCDSAARRELERVGYLRDTEAGVSVSHDAVAEAIVALASVTERRDASRDLGTILIDSNEPPWDEHGIRHLANAGEIDGLRSPLTAVARRRLVDSQITPISVTATVLGRTPGDPLVALAVRMLPLSLRLRRFRRRAVVVVTSLLVLGGIGAIRHSMASTARYAGLEIVESVGDQKVAVARVALDRIGWVDGDALPARFSRPRSDSLPRARNGGLFVPNEDAWAFSIQSADSGGVDVAMTTRAGIERRLTRSRGDETPGAWSPDGRLLAILTSSFSATKFKTLAILDPVSGVVRPLGSVDSVVSTVAWSPDGTRIAYAAGSLDAPERNLCITSVDGSQRSCLAVSPRTVRVVGWLSDSRILVSRGPIQPLDEFDLARQQFRPIGLDSTTAVDLSPDGRWLAYEKPVATGRELFVAPSDSPRRARLVATDSAIRSDAVMAWEGRFIEREYLDSLVIEPLRDSIPLGASFRLRARALSNLGSEISVHSAEWKSLSPAVATIDSTGTIQLRGPGVLTVELSAGGWRTARRTFTIFKDTNRTIVDESWTNPFDGRWVRFGHPFPTIVHDSVVGRAFFNNGDGYYFSGAHFAQPVDGRRGLAMDAVVRLPITLPQEQYLELGFWGGRGLVEAQRKWNHITGYHPGVTAQFNCSLVYPEHEGSTGALGVNLMGELSREPGETLPALGRGTPTHVRIQIFPDGRCGLAVQGQIPWISGPVVSPIDSFLVAIQGNSVGTRLLVGPLTVRTGIPPGVDWSMARPYR